MYSPIDRDDLLWLALQEDIGLYDKTTEALIPSRIRCRAEFIAKAEGIVSGISVARRLFELQGTEIEQWECVAEGAKVEKGQIIASFEGNADAILTTERVALNFLKHLSGIATLTANYVSRIRDLPVRICHTRKTMPLLRAMEVEAVVHGGGHRHRFNLTDGILIKENHIEIVGTIKDAVEKVRQRVSHLEKIEVEVMNLDQVREALEAGADAILLDNMSVEDMREAVKMSQGSPVLLEASGNITLERVRPVAETGVHIISVGAITHSVTALDISLLVRKS